MSTTRTPATLWWSDKWAWRGAIAGAPAGALVAIVHALVVLRASVEQALVAYAVGAMVASGIGCLLAGPAGAVGIGLRRRLAGRGGTAPQGGTTTATAGPSAQRGSLASAA